MSIRERVGAGLNTALSETTPNIRDKRTKNGANIRTGVTGGKHARLSTTMTLARKSIEDRESWQGWEFRQDRECRQAREE